ncbi:GerW family sporulation protein [Dysosmobacter sp.]|jgi:sporulation protein YtfJ|uniref:GerW family sporulation protein n=1 Tax=Dysosmobacter sp. TaxID=2591382 RepID=UPI002D7F3951|nr:GerW family sporulation protein [uncultured Oscillibacter sp.]
MENPAENSKRHPLNDLMQSTMDRIREMVDTNTIVGQPITTPDGVTLIPISKVSFGFGSGGADYGKTTPKENFGGGSAAGVRIDPVAFLVIREGNTRVLPVAVPPATTVDRVIDMVPDLLEKVEKYLDKKEEKEPC